MIRLAASADPLNFIPDEIPKSIEGAKVYHHKADCFRMGKWSTWSFFAS